MQENNKRIAKNTLFLYFRMLLVMAVSLYTVRIVLNTLGKVDYGIYNVVGGVVVVFSFISNTLTASSLRFFAFGLGQENQEQVRKTFCAVMTIFIGLVVVIIIFSETVGLWFLNNKMNIPLERMFAANVVYQLSVLSFVVNMLTTPYTALIIAHERMNIYAYIGIIDIILRLLIVYLLLVFMVDKLILYAILIFLVTNIMAMIYGIYCKKKFIECQFSFNWDKSLYKELASFSGWNLIGGLSSMMKGQGTNILLNVFFGPIVNTAWGIANRVELAINQIVNGFFQATSPQITKLYAANRKQEMFHLVFRSSKVSCFLLLPIALLILFEINFLSTFWLVNVPEYAISFTKLVIILQLIDSFTLPLAGIVHATGKMALYQTLIYGTQLLILPISYIFLKFGYQPEIVFYIMIIITVVCFVLRLIVLKYLAQLSIYSFIKDVIIKSAIVFLLVYIPLQCIVFYFEESLSRLIVVILTDIFIAGIATFFIGLTKQERIVVKSYIYKKLMHKEMY
jgi:O-antigen/teichoic acid export membrane protein